MDAYTSQYTSEQIDQGLNVSLGMIQIISLITQYGYDASLIQNPEWSYIVLDSQGRILAGIRVDGSAYMAIL